MIEKPLLGLVPRYIVDEYRIDDIRKAIFRYIEAREPIPLEWITEYNELVVKIYEDDDRKIMIPEHTCYECFHNSLKKIYDKERNLIEVICMDCGYNVKNR